MIRGTILALAIVTLASPATAEVVCETKPPVCQTKKDRSEASETRKNRNKQEVCVRRYALM